MIEARVAKIVMVGSLALFAIVAAFDNIADYDVNFEFVRHVLSMDTTFPGNSLLYRRITSPVLWNAAYWLIILGEGLVAASSALGAVAMLRNLRADALRFNRSKRFALIGATLAFIVWFFGFMVIGGEWFQMWQSVSWNGQEAAFRFYATFLAVLIFVNQKDDDLQPDRR